MIAVIIQLKTATKMNFLSSVCVILSVCGLIFAGMDQDFAQNTRAISQQCLQSNHVNPLQLVELTMMKIPTNRNVQCYLACMSKALGAMSADNTFSKDGITAMASPYMAQIEQSGMKGKLEQIVDTCIAQQTGGTDECEIARVAMECIVTNYQA